MSCVIGLLHEGKVYIASEGIATTDDGEKRPIIANKVFRNDKYLIGFTGSVRSGQILGPKFFEPNKSVVAVGNKLKFPPKQKNIAQVMKRKYISSKFVVK